MAAPPAYQAVDDTPAPGPDDLTAPFTDLQIDSLPHEPDSSTCLAHLRLLFAFEALKEDIGYTDGLWGLWDTRADGNIVVHENGDVDEHPAAGEFNHELEDKKKSLSKVREKRWALFVARAVDRYEAWWNSLPRELMPLTEGDMSDKNSPSFVQFPIGESPRWWEKKALPPLGESIQLQKKTSTDDSRCPDGISLSHVEPLQLPRRLHPPRPPPILAVRHAMESRQRRNRRLLQLQRL
jgi:hypothetical protein